MAQLINALETPKIQNSEESNPIVNNVFLLKMLI